MDFGQLRSMALFGDSLIADRAELKAKNEMSALTLALARRAAKESGVDESEIEASRKELGISKETKKE